MFGKESAVLAAALHVALPLTVLLQGDASGVLLGSCVSRQPDIVGRLTQHFGGGKSRHVAISRIDLQHHTVSIKNHDGLLGIDEGFMGQSQFLLVLFVVGDILEHPDRTVQIALGAFKRGLGEDHIAFDSRPIADKAFVFLHAALGKQLLIGPVVNGGQMFGIKIEHLFADDLLAGQTDEYLEGLITAQIAVIDALVKHRNGNGVHQLGDKTGMVRGLPLQHDLLVHVHQNADDRGPITIEGANPEDFGEK